MDVLPPSNQLRVLSTLEFPFLLGLWRSVQQGLPSREVGCGFEQEGDVSPTCTDIDLLPAEDQAAGVVVSLRTTEENIACEGTNKEMRRGSCRTHPYTGALSDASGAVDRLAQSARSLRPNLPFDPRKRTLISLSIEIQNK